MLEVRPMGLNDYYMIKQKLRKKNRIGYDIEWLKMDRLAMCYVFFYKNDLVCFTGIDYLEEDMRILTRGTTFKGCPKPWGSTIEERTFPMSTAGISLKYSKYIEPDKPVVTTFEHPTRFSKVMRNSKLTSMKYRETKVIYGVTQDVYEWDVESCHELTGNYLKKYNIDYGETDVWM